MVGPIKAGDMRSEENIPKKSVNNKDGNHLPEA
jgi:hypothetical protein